MHPALKATMAAATLALATTAPASARGRDCAHAGRSYSAVGTLADGSTLARVAGASTKRTSDDRYSGTLDVTVTQAGRESALGLHAYVVTKVRIRGTAGDAVPATGTTITLTGLSLSAAAARRCHVEEPTASRASVDASAAVYAGTDDDAPAVVTGVQIKAVTFGGNAAKATPTKGRHAASGAASDDDSDTDDASDANAGDSSDTTADPTADDGTSATAADDPGDDGDDSGDDA